MSKVTLFGVRDTRNGYECLQAPGTQKEPLHVTKQAITHELKDSLSQDAIHLQGTK